MTVNPGLYRNTLFLKASVTAIMFAMLVFAHHAQANESYLPHWKAETTVSAVALTFDDGPKPEYSLPVLEILDRYCVKGTFFVVGKMARMHPDIIYRMASSGHEIGNHTYSHLRLDNFAMNQIRDELYMTNQVVEKITGKKPKYFRPPGGRFNSLVLQGAEKEGLRTINWSLNAADYTPETGVPMVSIRDKSIDIIDVVVNSVSSGDIILFHNGGFDTEKALPKIIEKLREKGYKMVTVSELLGYDSDFFTKDVVKLN